MYNSIFISSKLLSAITSLVEVLGSHPSDLLEEQKLGSDSVICDDMKHGKRKFG